MMDKQLVIATKDTFKDTLHLLLELAERAQDVGYPGNGVEIYVPDYLMDSYIKATTPRAKRAKKDREEEG